LEEGETSDCRCGGGIIGGGRPAKNCPARNGRGTEKGSIEVDDTTQDLRRRWDDLLARLGVEAEAGTEWLGRLLEAYAAPVRFYHTRTHLAAVLRALDAGTETPPASVVLAAWFHDAVYDPRAGDNEERSADLAVEACREWRLDVEIAEEVRRLILLTRTHEVGDDDDAGALLLDADLAILGAPAEEYEGYARAIRQEYAWVPEEPYRAGRAQVLRRFLDRPRIYRLPANADREPRARENLARELLRLTSPA
jgi:predicted metal-dependent HD superfamily phosphohydrolase